jgi:GntR family transcriptional regulator
MVTEVTAHGRLTELLRSRMREGAYGVGARLPTEMELAEEYGVSRQTVRRAYQSLVNQGLVHRTRGRGTFVSAVPPDGRYLRTFGSVDDLMAQSADSTMEIIEPLQTVCDEWLSNKLLCPARPIGTLLLRRRHGGGEVFCLTKVAVPEAVMGALSPLELQTGFMAGTIISAIEDVGHARIYGAKQRIQAELCPSWATAHLDCGPNEPVLHVERLYYDDRGEPVEFADTLYVGRRFAYQIELLRTSC